MARRGRGQADESRQRRPAGTTSRSVRPRWRRREAGAGSLGKNARGGRTGAGVGVALEVVSRGGRVADGNGAAAVAATGGPRRDRAGCHGDYPLARARDRKSVV